jgi:hypothetical protein
MKAMKSLVVAAIAATGLATVADAQADRGTWRSGAARPVGGHWSGGHWGGGHWGGYRSHFYGPRFGVFIGAPLLWPSWYWGYPYDYYYPRTVIYRDVIEPYPASYPDGVMMDPAPTTELPPRVEGAPRQGPLYMNYCESAKAYFPKVTSCPEGWKFLAPTQ